MFLCVINHPDHASKHVGLIHLLYTNANVFIDRITLNNQPKHIFYCPTLAMASAGTVQPSRIVSAVNGCSHAVPELEQHLRVALAEPVRGEVHQLDDVEGASAETRQTS